MMQPAEKRDKECCHTRLVETKVLVLPAKVEEESLGANVQVPLLVRRSGVGCCGRGFRSQSFPAAL